MALLSGRPLTEASYRKGISVVCNRDPDLGRVVKTHGPPPMWSRKPGFASLVHIILEQQVSLASARAAYNRLLEAVADLDPAEFLMLDDEQLRRIGFSRQKTRYCKNLARAIRRGSLDIDALEGMDDHRIRGELLAISGIGSWTADIYTLMALRRPDVWPTGDLALKVAAQHLKNLPGRPSADDLAVIGELWKPWRSVAARILWHYYLESSARSAAD